MKKQRNKGIKLFSFMKLNKEKYTKHILKMLLNDKVFLHQQPFNETIVIIC